MGLGAVLLAALTWPASVLAAGTPTVVGSVGDSTDLSGVDSVAVSGHYAYTTAYWPGALTVVDVSNPSSPTVVGSTPATTSLENGSNVTIAGNYAFVVSKNRNASHSSNDDGSGNSLTVVDISDPSNPAILGAVHDPSTLFGAYGVAVSGQYAFVAYQGLLLGQPSSPDTSSGGFSVIDLTNLAAGVVANLDNASLPPPWSGQNVLEHATSVAISGHYAYVNAFYNSSITVIDISNPLAPAIVASLNDPANLPAPVDLAIQGNDLYVANQTSGSSRQFSIVNITDPTHPAVVGALSNGAVLDNAYRIRVRGPFAYVAARNSNAVAAIDVSNPANPRLAGYVQDAAHLFSTTGLDLDPSGRYVIADSARLSTDSNLAYPPFTPAQGTISVVDLIPNPIAVTIAASSEPSNPTTRTSASFSFGVDDDVSSVQCALDGGSLRSCTTPTTQTYTGLAAGSHTFTVRATDAAGNTATDSYTWTVGGSVPTSGSPAPTNTSPPTPAGPAHPTPSQVRAALARVLTPSGKSARIGALLEAGGYRFSFPTPSAGRLTISWSYQPKAVRSTKSKRAPAPVVVATVTLTFSRSGAAIVKVKLTTRGRRVLASSRWLRLTAKASFAPSAQAPVAALRGFTLAR